LPWEDGTVLRRLLEQLAALGVRSAHVITRPGWEETLRPSLDVPGRSPSTGSVQLHGSRDTAEDLSLIARVARGADGDLVVACADVVTHGEALAGLLADPRLATGILGTGRRIGRGFAFRARAARGRVLSVASPYHAVRAPNLRFLGVLKVAGAHRAGLADDAERLAGLVSPVPGPWQEELDRKAGSWRLYFARTALGESPEDEPADPEDLTGADPRDVRLSPEDEAALDRWLAVAPQDAASLLVVGLVRSGVHVGISHLRELFWARPLSRGEAEDAAERITSYDEDRVLLDSAVKANDGFFTTFFVSPYSKYVARWAARRGWTPNQVTTVSLGIGVLASIAFATGARAGLIAGAILLQIAFTTDCVDGQLARYTRTFSRLGAWLDSIFDRTKEYAVFAGLAIGASRTGDPVWILAGSALALQTVRHAIDFSYPIAQHQALASARQPPIEQPSDSTRARLEADPPPEAAAPPRGPLAARVVRSTFGVWRVLDRQPGARWLKKIVAFPIGERFAVISITAAIWDARTTFIVLLAWGGGATVYKFTGRVLRSVMR
jgi:CDP-alcohol phosphatidyltransferase/Family of unknown function (DUF5941)